MQKARIWEARFSKLLNLLHWKKIFFLEFMKFSRVKNLHIFAYFSPATLKIFSLTDGLKIVVHVQQYPSED